CPHLLPRKTTLLWLSSSWYLNLAFADLMKATPSHLIGSWDLHNAKPNPKFQRLRMIIKGIGKLKTKALVVFKLDEEANAVYTQDMGDLFIYLTKSDPLCVPTNSWIPLPPNRVLILDVDESRRVSLCRTTS
ncbi:hypothetical protein ISN44_As03g034380, partial [Arabidopsis suecica]